MKFGLAIVAMAFVAVTVHAAPQDIGSLLEQRSNKLPICVPPRLTGAIGKYPKSAVTTKQTGKNCSKFGDPPARVVGPLEGPTGLEDLIAICPGEIVSTTDNLGEKRHSCLYINPASTKDKPLPLLVWLNPSLVSASIAFPLTGIDAIKKTQALNNEDQSRLGFSYILPFGRNTIHQYPVPDNAGVGWDNWYRNLDRSSKDLNADVDFLDKAIALAKSRVPVDNRRVFMSGWSNGAAMAFLYALNTDGIASASVYSAPDPYRDSEDPCTQTPYPRYATPTLDVHNYCDILGICTTGKYFYDDLRKRYPSLKQSLVVIDTLTAVVKSRDDSAKCDPVCQGSCAVTAGTVAHLRYPAARNADTIFSFLHDNPLPASGTWGAP